MLGGNVYYIAYPRTSLLLHSLNDKLNASIVGISEHGLVSLASDEYFSTNSSTLGKAMSNHHLDYVCSFSISELRHSYLAILARGMLF